MTSLIHPVSLEVVRHNEFENGVYFVITDADTAANLVRILVDPQVKALILVNPQVKASSVISYCN